MIIRDLRVTEENRAQTAARGIEEIRPVPLDLPVLQHVEGQPVPVETQAGFEVADHHYGMMDSSGHHSTGPAARHHYDLEFPCPRLRSSRLTRFHCPGTGQGITRVRGQAFSVTVGTCLVKHTKPNDVVRGTGIEER